MNIYKSLNEIITYIEENLEQDINYSKMAQIMTTNEYTMKKVFQLLTNIPISEYIRNRKLSNAGFDLYKNNEKIIDVAIKYHYDNPTSFSRAFEKFHGIKPSNNMEYSIVELEEKILYGKGIKTAYSTIQKDAPNFFSKMRKKYFSKYGEIDYGIVMYEERFESNQFEYWIAYEKEVEDFEKILIPKSKWLKFVIKSQEPLDIQKVSRAFYEKFITSSKFKLRPLPELEYYYDNITEFLIPIED